MEMEKMKRKLIRMVEGRHYHLKLWIMLLKINEASLSNKEDFITYFAIIMDVGYVVS